MMYPRMYFLLVCIFLAGCAAHSPEHETFDPAIPVQSGTASMRLKMNADSTVTDKTTGLMWAAAGNGKAVEWQACDAVVRDFSKAGHTDWRLPSLLELKALFDKKNQEIYQTRTFITTGGPRVWSRNVNFGSELVGYFNVSDGYSLFTPMNGDLKASVIVVRPLTQEEMTQDSQLK